MARSSTSHHKAIEILRSKFNRKTTLELLRKAEEVNWDAEISTVCQECKIVSEDELGGKYVWMVAENPTYFIQYQIDSYAFMRGYGRVILVWKPKYLQYLTITKPINYGDHPKIIKSMDVSIVDQIGNCSETFNEEIQQFIIKFYGLKFYSLDQQEFQTQLMLELKNHVTRMAKVMYWHCCIDKHNRIGVSSTNGPLLKIRVKGINQKYDKDIIMFSHQGKRDFLLRGKKMQTISFLAMLLIFVTVVSCKEGETEGICSFKNEMMMGAAALMMGLVGMRVYSRNQNKRKLQKKINDSEKRLRD